MEPLGLSAYKVSKDTYISSMALSEILRGKRSITPRVGIRLAKYFGLSEGYFSRLQLQYDLDIIKEKEGGEVKKISRLKSLLSYGNTYPANMNPDDKSLDIS